MRKDKRVKISCEEWEKEISIPVTKEKFRFMCEYTLLKKIEDENNPIVATERIKLSFFILLYIPELIRKIHVAMWEDGFKNLTLPNRYLNIIQIKSWYANYDKINDKYFSIKG